MEYKSYETVGRSERFYNVSGRQMQNKNNDKVNILIQCLT